MCIKRSDVTTLAFTSVQDDSRALSLIDLLMFLLGLPPACRAILECCRSVFVFAFISAQDDTCVCSIIIMSTERLNVTALAFKSSKTLSEPCRFFLTRCFRLSFHQQAELYLSAAAPSLPSRSPARRMILARVRSF